MPNRIIKESICSSDSLNQLSDFEFRLWVGLLVSADDAGRGDARPAIIKGHVFPLRDRVTTKSIEDALHGLATAGCVSLYTVGGKPYFRFPTWAAHQRIDRAKPKFPAPEDGEPMQISSVRGNPPQSAANCGEPRAESNPNPIQSESESEVETRTREDSPAATLEAYASGNLQYMSPRNMEELDSFREDLPEAVIRYAIDEACANGKRTWAYVKAILNRYVQDGVKTIGDIRNREQKREKSANNARTANNPALNYEQRKHTEDDYAGLFINLDEYDGGGTK